MNKQSYDLLNEFLGFDSPLGMNMNLDTFSAERLLEKVDEIEELINAYPDDFLPTTEDDRAIVRLKEIAQDVRNGYDVEEQRFKLANALSWCLQGHGSAAEHAPGTTYRTGAIEDAVHMMG